MTGFSRNQALFASKVVAAYDNRDADPLLDDYNRLQKNN